MANTSSPARSTEYLAHVRARACWFCGTTADVVAHHHGRAAGGGGMGLKTCDFHTVPLCPSHHGEWHRRGQVQGYNRDQTEREMWKAIGVTLRGYLLEVLEKGTDA